MTFGVDTRQLRYPTPDVLARGHRSGLGGDGRRTSFPLTADADSAALACALEPEVVVLVSDAGLGAINAALLCMPLLPTPVRWPGWLVL